MRSKFSIRRHDNHTLGVTLDRYTTCDAISFNSRGQLCPLMCAEWRDLSNHTRISTIQSRTLEKKAKTHVTLTLKLPWKSCSTTHLPFFSPNLKILKALVKTFPTKMKLPKYTTKEKKEARKVKKVGEKAKFCFLSVPELLKLIFCIWIRRPRRVRPVNGLPLNYGMIFPFLLQIYLQLMLLRRHLKLIYFRRRFPANLLFLFFL